MPEQEDNNQQQTQQQQVQVVETDRQRVVIDTNQLEKKNFDLTKTEKSN